MFSANLPAGRYFVGDPCYVFPDHEWFRFCNSLFSEAVGGDGNINSFGDTPMFASCTAFGDGTYRDINSNASFGVDSGLLGAVPESLWNTELTDDQVTKLGTIIIAEHAFNAHVTSDYEFHVGMLIIPTKEGNIDDADAADDYPGIEL